ncbi:phage tail protein [Vibrio sp. AK197]
MSTYFTILTTVGEAKLANATALGLTVKLTQMAIGDGNGSLPTPQQEQTALVNEVRRAALNSVDVDKDNLNWIVCEQVLPESIGGWTIREVGLYDEDDDLIAIGNFPETYKPILAEGSGRTQTIRMVLQVSATASVELKIDPSIVLATREYVDKKDAAHVAAVDPHPQYVLKAQAQFEPYDNSRIYTCGEVCTTLEKGELLYWQWYSNLESLSGKSPLDESNRQVGWSAIDKPFYWIPYKGDITGMPFYWLDVSAPEWAVMEINVDLPVRVYWRLARLYPELVFTADDVEYINTGEIRGEYLRVLDQGRGIDVDRALGSSQSASGGGLAQLATGGWTGNVRRVVDVPSDGSWSEYTSTGRSTPYSVGVRARNSTDGVNVRNVARPMAIAI